MSRRSRGAFVLEPMKLEEDDVSERRHHLGRRAFPDTTRVVAQGPVAHAVEAILNTPVFSSKVQ
jgi:hypothetical protein